jgi:hypothetical protein
MCVDNCRNNKSFYKWSMTSLTKISLINILLVKDNECYEE